MEEVIFLRSIYCKPSECVLHPPYNFDTLEQLLPDQCREPICLTLLIQCQAHNGMSLSARFELPIGYPTIPPRVLLSSDDYCAKTVSGLQDDVNNHVTTNCNEPCIFSTTEFIRDRLDSMASKELNSLEPHCSVTKGDPKLLQPKLMSAQRNTFCILHLDHIRCEAKYFKTLKSWSQELSICGRIITAGLHFIYVILIGSSDSLQELLHRWRTAPIDVDARGRPCKERLMSILCQQRLDDNHLSDRYGK